MKQIFSITLSTCLFAALGATAVADTARTFASKVQPVLKTYCIQCHGPDTQEGDINLSGNHTLETLLDSKDVWFRVLDQLEFQEMPPEDEKQPTDAERQAVINWIKGDLTQSVSQKNLESGRSRFRRLTRAEYANAVTDLFGVRPEVDMLPADSRVRGFTKKPDALPMSMDGAYGYYTTVDELLDNWLLNKLPKDAGEPSIRRSEARTTGQSGGHSLELPDNWHVYFNTDDTSGRIKDYGMFKVPGRHTVRVHVYGYQTDKPLPFGVYLGTTWSYPQKIRLAGLGVAPPGKPAVIEVEVDAEKGDGLRIIPFGLGEQVPKNSQASKCKGPGLAMQWVEVVGPPLPVAGDAWLTQDFPPELIEAMRGKHGHLRDPAKKNDKGLDMTPEEVVDVMRTTLARVGARLWRRDLTTAELDDLLEHVQQGLIEGRHVRGIYAEALVDMMTSPNFFCVVESSGELDDFALANRLALFLWNSFPDEELMELARANRLSRPAVLREQTERMLDDPKAERFVADFLEQWLDLHALDDTTPDNRLYPEYDELLKFSSVQQTRAFFSRVLAENRSVRDLVAPDWMMVNSRLAEHYGIGGVTGTKMRVVRRPKDSPFGGLWTQPVIMKVTADGSSTSPVKRGVWMSERLLGVPISPPPPNIEPIDPDTRGATTVREQLALHSKEGNCASCHRKFDPYGFAMESFDVMGNFREHYRVLNADRQKNEPRWTDGLPVDPHGVTPQGEAFTDITALRQLLAEQPDRVAWGVTWHLMTYATATPTSPLDRAAIQQVVDGAKKDDYGLRSIVHGIVQSETFRNK